jgi:hypothetical protein
MNQRDVKEVLLTAIKGVGLQTKEDFSIKDISKLADQVWHNSEFQEYLEMRINSEKKVYHIQRSNLDELFSSRFIEFKYDEDKKIRFIITDDSKVEVTYLENGGVLIWYEGDEE